MLEPSDAWVATAISACASAYGVAIVTIVLFAIALRKRRGLYAVAAVLCIQLASAQTVTFMKYWFDRSRPLQHIVVETMPSYPSGHAAGAIAFFGGVTWLVWASWLPSWWKRTFTVTLTILILGIGWSRIALGAHYVTDVIGGYLMGGAWLLAGTAVFDSVARAHKT